MKVREFSLHKEKERQIEEENKKEKELKEQAQQSQQSSSKGSAGETKIKKSKNRLTKLIGNITQKLNNRKNRDETESYAQQPIEMNPLIRKRRLYFFPNMEKASYLIRRSPDGSCLIVDK